MSITTDTKDWAWVLARPCHIRDVHERFAQRPQLMLDQDDPTLANWDQDATAA